MKSICVYCGSSPGILPEYAAAATQFGRLLALRGIELVFGGGNVGLMGAVADGALDAGGRVTGVIPRRLQEKEVAHKNLTELHCVSSMHERKTMMADLSDAFVALPGGIGTLEEIFEVYTWTQLGFHRKPCAFLNVAGFYSGLFSFLEFMVEQRFVKDEHYRSLIVDSDGARLIDRIAAYEHV
ncbi:MAG: TIGR00730 family Rossman fold protein, partial [Chlorobium limicola]|nr:TIGR00730 family Rossman fold protein [Chlorobium limicola]